MPVFAPTTALQMTPSGKLLVAPQGTVEQDSVPSGPGAQPVGQDSDTRAQSPLKAAMPAPSPGPPQSKDSVPKAGSPVEDSGSVMVHPGEVSETKTPPTHLGRQGSPGQLCVKPRTPRHGLVSWGEGLVTAQGGTLPGTKTSAREGGPGCSLTLPKARASSTPRDSIQLAKRHHSQPQAGPGHFSHVVSIEIGALSALRPASPPKAEAELREEPEKMEMEEQPPAGKEEAPGTVLEEVDLGNKPPTPPLHRFPSWVRGSLGTGQWGRADDDMNAACQAEPRIGSWMRLSPSCCFARWLPPSLPRPPHPHWAEPGLLTDWTMVGSRFLSKCLPWATCLAGCLVHVFFFLIMIFIFSIIVG